MGFDTRLITAYVPFDTLTSDRYGATSVHSPCCCFDLIQPRSIPVTYEGCEHRVEQEACQARANDCCGLLVLSALQMQGKLNVVALSFFKSPNMVPSLKENHHSTTIRILHLRVPCSVTVLYPCVGTVQQKEEQNANMTTKEENAEQWFYEKPSAN